MRINRNKMAFTQLNNRKANLMAFTLIEVLTSLLIFISVSIVLAGVVVQMARLQETVTGRNQQISELRFALEYISTSVANAQNPPPTAECIILANANFEEFTEAGRKGIRFVNRDGRCQEIFLSSLVGGFGKIQTRISTDHTGVGLAAPINLTSDIITRFDIYLMGNTIGIADGQPRVTISIASNIEGLDLPMTVQRSISRIKLDN